MNEDEFEASWSILSYALNHDDTKDILSEKGCKKIQELIHECVQPHLDHMCYYVKLIQYFLDEHTNYGQKGTHNGMKNCTSPVMPMQNLDRSVDVTTFNKEVFKKSI